MNRPARRLDLRLITLILILHIAFPAGAALAAGYPPKTGRSHPALVLPTLEGDTAIALSSLRGKKVLVIHFASWSAKSRKEIPLWHEKTKTFVADGKLAVLGVAHEQHADRCRLFAQWKDIDWPILHDPLNLIDVDAFPLVVAVDEHGIVRAVKLQPEHLAEAFLDQEYKAPAKPLPLGPAGLVNPKITRRTAGEARSSEGWRDHGDALVLAGRPALINEAIDVYGRVLKMKDDDANAWFRLGVARRIRHDRPEHQEGDFQAAVDAWRKAVQIKPDNAVFAARLRQYKPSLDKPHAYYDWVDTAMKEIITRGRTPVRLAAEPCSTERGLPADESAKEKKAPVGDDAGLLQRPDEDNLVGVEQTVAHGAGDDAAAVVTVHLTFRPDADRAVHWDDAKGGLSARVDPPEGCKLAQTSIKYAPLPETAPDGARTLSFDVQLPRSSKKAISVSVHAAYAVRAGESAPSQLLGREIAVKISKAID